LQRLNIAGSKVTDVSPIAGLPLTRLILTPQNISAGLDKVRQMTTLRELDLQYEPDTQRTMSPDEFWARYDAGEFHSPVDPK
jgi:hypothetical protein